MKFQRFINHNSYIWILKAHYSSPFLEFVKHWNETKILFFFSKGQREVWRNLYQKDRIKTRAGVVFWVETRQKNCTTRGMCPHTHTPLSQLQNNNDQLTTQASLLGQKSQLGVEMQSKYIPLFFQNLWNKKKILMILIKTPDRVFNFFSM